MYVRSGIESNQIDGVLLLCYASVLIVLVW